LPVAHKSPIPPHHDQVLLPLPPRSVAQPMVTAPQYATRYAELNRRFPLRSRLRAMVRNTVVSGLSLTSRIARAGEWIRFPFWHFVFDDERAGFTRQLRYLRNFGDFIALDDAVSLLQTKSAIGGRYFCVTFDDGLKNVWTNAVPILHELDCPAAMYVPTAYIGKTLADDPELMARYFEPTRDAYPLPVEFLSWDDCRSMAAAGVTIGAHTVSHVRLATLDEAGVRRELGESKAAVEREMGGVCRHFCAPWGFPERDFVPDRDTRIAREIGFESLVTTLRGAARQGDDPFFIRRDHFLAGWGNAQLRYFLSRG